ncbi:Sorting nexin-10A [Labeo rohita]|uniref:Sorting nexin-10A n=1 Tax=Labeo rohita TaxID=84645 RepID=A0ABQ8LTH4_LABRO|nr:Sorting nexin-10A [Labeo rohita]
MSTNEQENLGEQQSGQLLPEERNIVSNQILKTSQAHQHMEDKDQDNESPRSTWTTVAKIHNTTEKEFISVWVRDPQGHKEDFWHAYISYEICLHTNSMCFRKKTSCVRRRILQTPLLLSDSLLHLFLQSQLSIAKMDVCAQGQTHYTVAQAIQRCVSCVRFPVEEQQQEEDSKTCCDSDCESTTSSGLGNSTGRATPVEEDYSYNESFSHEFQATTSEAELCSSLSSSPGDQ